MERLSCFSIRNVTCDHYMTNPVAELDPLSIVEDSQTSSSVDFVPVIRMFGILDSSEKCCLHIHGVFPYILVECSRFLDQLEIFACQLQVALETGLNLASKKMYSSSTVPPNRRPASPFVRKIKIVNGFPFYGYYNERRTFCKIYLYNPAMVKLTVELLERGAILDTNFQSFESHVPFILQFFLDFSIFGMDYVHVKRVKIRRHHQNPASVFNSHSNLLSPSKPSTNMAVEADCHVSDILNRKNNFTNMQNPGIEAIWRDERLRCAEGEKLESVSQADLHLPDSFLQVLTDLQTMADTSMCTPCSFRHDQTLQMDEPDRTAEEADENDHDMTRELRSFNTEGAQLSSDDASDNDRKRKMSNSTPNRFLSSGQEQKPMRTNEPVRRRLISDSIVENRKPPSSIPVDPRPFIEPQLSSSAALGGFGFDQSAIALQNAGNLREISHLTVLTIEVHVRTRRDLLADPVHDPICAIFFSICKNACKVGSSMHIGCIVMSGTKNKLTIGLIDWTDVTIVDTELELIQQTVRMVESYDPDILLGFDIERHSWGFLVERGAILSLNLCRQLSRVTNLNESFNGPSACSEVHISGRIVLNLWRILKHETALGSYTFSSFVYHLLHRRIPHFSPQNLTEWFDCDSAKLRRRVFDFYRLKVDLQMVLLSRCDILDRTAEMARLYGLQFYDVLSRGTQAFNRHRSCFPIEFRVESTLLRITRRENFVTPSPNPTERSKMTPPSCIALNLQPDSKFYTDPVIVLDFQALYPSICIAYNYCYSTCLGRIDHLINGSLVLAEKVHLSPSAVAFVVSQVREGILPRMLRQLLSTRLMVKKRIKVCQSNSALTRLLDARQLALKLLANTTYGYTAANITGRMPCVELADSIVSKGRETLERAIQQVNQGVHQWGGRVIYGDTDSLFIVLPGKTKSEAFDIGTEIALAVTNANPAPVELKFEKVFLPCLLQSKKRYVGYSYENRHQLEPKFDAKGIETVRRDACPIVSKVLEKSIRLLFDSNGQIDPVHRYVSLELSRILHGNLTLDEFIFAKEYRGRQGYAENASVPSLAIARWAKMGMPNDFVSSTSE